MRLTLKRALQALVVASILYAVLRPLVAGWRELTPALWPRFWGAFVLASVLLLGCFLGAALIWWMIASRLAGTHLRVQTGLRVWFLANMGRYLPGKVWTLAGVAYLGRQAGLPPVACSSAMILSQALAVLSGLTLGLATLPSSLPLPPLLTRWGPILAILFLPFLSPQLLETVINRGLAMLRRPPIRVPFRFRELLGWFFLTGLLWVAYGVAFFLFIRTFHPAPAASLLPVIGVYCTGYVVGFLALFSPAGLGVREGFFALLLSPLVPPATASLVALASRLWLTIMELFPVGVALVATARTTRTSPGKAG